MSLIPLVMKHRDLLVKLSDSSNLSDSQPALISEHQMGVSSIIGFSITPVYSTQSESEPDWRDHRLHCGSLLKLKNTLSRCRGSERAQITPGQLPKLQVALIAFSLPTQAQISLIWRANPQLLFQFDWPVFLTSLRRLKFLDKLDRSVRFFEETSQNAEKKRRALETERRRIRERTKTLWRWASNRDRKDRKGGFGNHTDDRQV